MDEVGSALSTASLYLQEPPSFNRDFMYRNPHILSWPSECTPTFLEHRIDAALDLANDIDSIINGSAPVHVPTALTQSSSINKALKPWVIMLLWIFEIDCDIDLVTNSRDCNSC
jgi:hypothetical protein